MAVPERHLGLWQELRELARAMSRFLTPSHKRQLLAVSLWACAVSIMEMLVAAAVIPYVQCLSGECPAPLQQASERLDWPLVPALSVGLLALITLKLLFQALFTWRSVAFNQQVQRDTVRRLLHGYLHLDWPSFRAHHQAHYFRRCAITAVDAAYVSQHCVTMISSALLLAFLIALMLWQYPLGSLVLGVSFALINLATQRLLGRAQEATARLREDALQRWNLGMAEAFSSFREIRVYGLETFFLEQFTRAIDSLAGANRKLGVYPTLPRLVLDFAVLGTLLFIVSVWMVLERPLADLLPQLVFYAVVARVLLPAMINLLSTRSALYGAIINIELVQEELDRCEQAYSPRVCIAPVPGEQPAFKLQQVTFAHVPKHPPVLKNVELSIAHPSWLAVIGRSGSGKSTLLELLCGIHQPQAGQVQHVWPQGSTPRVAYLPQQVALLDVSIMDNVIFGLDEGRPATVRELLKLTCLDDLVERLPEGLATRIGADGGRLSGGERQRLALARALYRDPDLLLLDEATSGLDEHTEQRLLAALRSARPNLTVVYITHRDSNLRFADSVMMLKDGVLQRVDQRLVQ